MTDKAKRPLVPKLRFPEFRDAGEWNKDQLGNISLFVKEKIPLNQLSLTNYVSTENILPEYEGLVIASKLPSSGTATRFKANDILISNIRPYLKKVCLAKKDGGASNDVIVVREKSKVIYQYLSFMLRNDAFIEYVMRGAKGVKMPRGDLSLMKEYPVAYPSKLEQQKIADCLSSLDERITLETQQLAALKTHKKGLMQQIFPAEGETVPKLRFPEFRDAGEWVETTLSKNLLRPPEYGINAAAVPYDLNLPTYLRITDISDDGQIRQAEKMSVAKGVTPDNYLDEGDIVLARTGASVGKAYKYRMKDGRLVFAGFLIRVKPDQNKLNSELLFQFLSTQRYWRWVAFTSARSGQPGINGNEYASLPIQLPPTLEEQQKIADCLSSLDAHITAQAKKIDLLKTHKKGLMQQLFPAPDEGQ